ncbi:hypothetical protein POM88_016084 [Heracleum sosnowskyi]|uniref:Uncharacterized protein n=1 Tax=Heracleum sosnowskyi TaxID=360622 RepID=A0AAD8ILW9_9APIA|nr:hypothetical protein POM88_016084 [Heracleum sosnowskyi]
MASSSQNIDELGECWNGLQIEDEEQGVLFDESEGLQDEVDARWCLVDTIVKPYGLFMKAPDRRNNRQIGARWLKDNMAQSLTGNSGVHETGSDDRRVQNSDARITDTVMNDGGNHGEVDGGTGGNIGKSVIMGGKSGEGGSLARIESGNYYSNLEEGVTVVENKRKRTQNEEVLGQSTMGQVLLIKSVDHVNEEKEEDIMQELDQRNEITNGSKNGLPAGLNTNVTGTFANWLEDKLRVFEGGKRQILAMLCWALWQVRNELVWNNKGPKVDTVMALAYNSLD